MSIFNKLDRDKKTVTGVGSALVDILAREADVFLEKVGAVKGGMQYVDDAVIDQTVRMLASPPFVVPGGSACNTVMGVARLGGPARFVGKCGNDELGRLFRNDLVKQGVQASLLTSEAPTGRVLSIITPDAQRSMFTFLGASAEALPEEMTPDLFADAAIVHIEGYLLFNPALITAVMQSARQAGALVSLDLASFTVVETAREILPGLVERYVDILLANEDEARAYTGISDETRSVQALAEKVSLAVLKIGARGSLMAHAGEVLAVKAVGGGDVVDTTGAGDLWASGLLYGLVQGMALDRCGRIASLCGYEVCRQVGAAIADERWQAIQNAIQDKGA